MFVVKSIFHIIRYSNTLRININVTVLNYQHMLSQHKLIMCDGMACICSCCYIYCNDNDTEKKFAYIPLMADSSAILIGYVNRPYEWAILIGSINGLWSH